jgi:hypothetical protein
MRYTLQEHLAKKLIPRDAIEERVSAVTKINKENVKILNESAKGKKRKLIVTMEAIHVGRTKNYTYYTEEGLKAGLSSWTHPYNKPVLTHHNEYDGEPIGRILKAEYSEKTLSGRPGLIFTCEITDPDAIEKVLDGRYQTVSIGASTDKVICNICGTDRTQEWCDHWPGEKYEDQTCHFIIGTTYGREVSYVNTPADENAGNRTVEIVMDDGDTQESVHVQVYQMAEGLYQNAQNPEVNLYEHLNEDVKKLLDAMSNVKEESGKQMDGKENKTTENVNVNNPEQTPNQGAPVQENQQGVQDNSNNTPENPQTPVQENKTVSGVTDLEEANKRISELEGKVSEMQATITKLVMEKVKLESRVSELESENNTLVSENARLVAEAHRALAEKVVDLKLSLRKSDVIGVAREEAIEAHVARTKESLTDTYNDLLAEAKQMRPEPGSVKNPGYAPEDNQTNESFQEEKMTAKEAVETMISMFSPKKRR